MHPLIFLKSQSNIDPTYKRKLTLFSRRGIVFLGASLAMGLYRTLGFSTDCRM